MISAYVYCNPDGREGMGLDGMGWDGRGEPRIIQEVALKYF